MRRRRDQAHAGNRMPQAGDHLVDFMAWQLPALTGFGTLCHLDLQLIRIHQVIRGYAEARRRYLLDGAATPVTIAVALVALLVFAAFSRVRPSSDPVHR